MAENERKEERTICVDKLVIHADQVIIEGKPHKPQPVQSVPVDKPVAQQPVRSPFGFPIFPPAPWQTHDERVNLN
ncbi:MAG: hypothetical protein ABF868_01230 [Sporolactobacillus sp.]